MFLYIDDFVTDIDNLINYYYFDIFYANLYTNSKGMPLLRSFVQVPFSCSLYAMYTMILVTHFLVFIIDKLPYIVYLHAFHLIMFVVY